MRSSEMPFTPKNPFSSDKTTKQRESPETIAAQVSAKKEYSAEEQAEHNREIALLLDLMLKEFIEHHARKINEGNNGVIFSIDFQELDPVLQTSLKEAGIELQDKKVAKVLKFGNRDDARQEFLMQRRFQKTIEQNGSVKPMAKVPKPITCRRIKMDDVLRDRLHSEGIKTLGDEIDVMIMDVVEGHDVATIMYREVLKYHPRAVHLATQVDQMNFAELQQEVASAIGFSIPGGKSRNEDERKAEQAAVDIENRKRLYTYLQSINFQFHPSIEAQMRNAMDTLHDQGLVHRDAHHRNFMIEGDHRPNAKTPPQVYLIDFGTAKVLDGTYSAQAFVEEQGEGARIQYLDDMMVPNDIKANFMQSPEEKRRAEKRKEMADIFKNFEKLRQNPARAAWVKSIEPGPKRNLHLIYAQSPAPKLASFIGLLEYAMRTGKVKKEEAEQILQNPDLGLTLPEKRLVESFLIALL